MAQKNAHISRTRNIRCSEDDRMTTQGRCETGAAIAAGNSRFATDGQPRFALTNEIDAFRGVSSKLHLGAYGAATVSAQLPTG